MIFKLKVLRNGALERWTYNNIENVFKMSDGSNPFEESKTDYELADIFDGDKNNISITNSTVDHLYIVLGTKCNFHCKYCHQRDVKTPMVEASPNLVEKFLDTLDRADLKLNFISFWGGEPLVYWKTIKLLLPELRKRYPHPQTRLSIQTNGSLFNKEMADHLLRVHCNLSVSYDGDASYRDASVLDDPKVVESLRYFGSQRDYKNLNIMPTQSQQTKLTSEVSDIVARVLDPRVDVSRMSIVRSNSDEFSGSIRISEDKRQLIEKDFYYHIMNETNPLLVQTFITKLHKIYCGVPAYADGYTFCPTSLGKGLSVDLAGNVLTCMNIPKQVVGNLDNLSSIRRNDFYHPLTKESCRMCPYLCMCYGGCPLVKNDTTEQFKNSCDNFKSLYKPMLKAAMERLFGVILLELEYPNGAKDKFL